MPDRVLVIDDSQLIHDVLRARLAPENVELLHAFDGQSGLRMAREQQPSLILLDLVLGMESGLYVCRLLQDDPELSAIPIVILTGAADTENKVKCLDAGAVDYITKPFDPDELRARVRVGLRIKRYHDLLSRQAHLDGMTGLWNRGYFDERLKAELAAAIRHDRSLGLMLIDLDHFKQINDSFGHPVGDRVLQQIAETVSGTVRQGSFVCRFGGDELSVIVREGHTAALGALGRRILEQVGKITISHRSGLIRPSVSIGGASRQELSADTEPLTPARLLAAADRGLYEAKQAGRGRVVVVTSDVVGVP
jgi:diguanylate cyclase (GGDEF)-like protein